MFQTRKSSRKRRRTVKAAASDQVPIDHNRPKAGKAAETKSKRRRAKSKKSSAATTAATTAVPMTDGPELSARDQADVAKSVAAAKRLAKAATKRAASEAVRRAQCFKEEASVMKKHAPTTNLSTKHSSRSFVRADAPPIRLGDFVDVTADRSPHNNCPGGVGWVTSVSGEGATLTACVNWSAVPGGSKDVPLSRLAKVQPFAAAPVRGCRQRAAEAKQAAKAAAAITPIPTPSDAPIYEALLLAKKLGKPFGWRRKEVCGSDDGRLSYEQKLKCGADVHALATFEAGLKAGGDRSAARLELGKQRTKGGRYELVERQQPWEGVKPLTKFYLAEAWGMGRASMNKWAKARPHSL